MTDYRSLYDKDFIGAWDLEGGDLTVTIKKCEAGNLTGVGGRKSKKPVIYMTHTDKGFCLNATNGKAIAAMYGTHVEKWAGKKITLFKSTTQFGSETMDCIRVRPQMPQQAEAVPLSQDEEAAEEIRILCKRKKFDEAADVARSIKDEAFRAEVEQRISKAKAYVDAQNTPQQEAA